MSILRRLLIFSLVTPFVLSLSVESSDLSKSIEKSDEDFSESIAADHNGASSSQEHSKLKINWGPVWDDIEGSNEFVVRFESEKEKCGATADKGLHNLIKQAKKVLPLQQIRDIIHSYAKDPKVKALEQYLRSADFKAKIIAIESSTEFQIIQSYTCNILHLDILHMTRDISQSSAESAEQESGGITGLSAEKDSDGIMGLLLKIHSVLPRDKLKHLYKRLLKSDEELAMAVAHLKSEEFHQMSLNLRNNVPAYKELMEKLQAIGVPVEEIRLYMEDIL